MAMTKQAKTADSFTGVEKPSSPRQGLFDRGRFDIARFDQVKTGGDKVAKPATTFTKQAKP